MQPVEVALVDAEPAQQPQRALGRVVGRLPAERGAALRDRAMEESARGRHRHQRRRLTAAAGLAEDRDAVGIAAEALDVVAHPRERRDEIL